MGFGSSSEAAQAPSRCLESPVFQRSDVWSDQTPTSSSSLEVFTPSAFPPLGAAASIDRACMSRSPAPSGFLNLMTLSSAPSLPALFHAGSALGVSPSKAFFLVRSRALFPTPFPSWRPNRLQGFAPRASPPLGQRFKLMSERVALLGIFPSRVFTLAAMSRPSPVLPSWSYSFGRKRPSKLPFRVFLAESPACLSRDCRPS